MALNDYIIVQIRLIPLFVYTLIASIFVIGCLLLLFLKNKNLLYQSVSVLFLLEYVFLIFGTTVIFRQTLAERQYHLIPFWSYTEKPYGHVLLLPETIVNIGMFIPIGFGICLLYKKIDWSKVLLIGAVVSSCIEISQLIFVKGFFEFDDILHNTFGCIIGYVIFKLLNGAWEYCNSRFVVNG